MNRSLAFYREHLADRPLMPALLAQGGIEVPRSGRIRCPLYDDHNPDVAVTPTALFDHGDADQRYDLLAVATQWLGHTLDQGVALLAELAGLTPPVSYSGEVRRVRYAELTPRVRVDPNSYAPLALRAEDALRAQATQASEAARRYLLERGLIESVDAYRVGVADQTVLARLPHPIWRDMLTFPNWHAGDLLSLKGRNLLPKDGGREMRNLTGAGTAPYGLQRLADGPVLVVEGETDTLSVWEAYEGDVNVVGIPGAGQWRKLQHETLRGRRLYVCLDADAAGQRGMDDLARWAADHGQPVTILPSIGDKNTVLVERGPAELRGALLSAVKCAQARTTRRLL